MSPENDEITQLLGALRGGNRDVNGSTRRKIDSCIRDGGAVIAKLTKTEDENRVHRS
jgi:hypothetical protein